MGAIAVPKSVGPLRVLRLRTLSDERLAELAGAGHSDACGVLYERYRDALSRYCRSIVRDPEDAGDALQNTMLAVLRALQGHGLTGPVRPWLYRIAHNESISILRRRHPHEELSVDTPDPTDTEGASLARARLDALLADLRSLPELQRGALVMRELGGLGYAEIAGALDLSPVTARKHVFEARAALHDIAAGRETDCGEIVRRISDGDGRVLRSRSVRGHLRGCPACSAFERGLRHRSETLTLIPALPLASTGALLGAVLHGGASTSGLATGGSVAGATVAVGSMAAAGSLGGGSFAAIKGFAVAGAIAVAGAGVIVGTGVSAHARHHHRTALMAARPLRVSRARGAAPPAAPAATTVRLAAVRTHPARAPSVPPATRLAPLPSARRPVSSVAPPPHAERPTTSTPIQQAPTSAVPVAVTTPAATPTPTPSPSTATPPAATTPPTGTTSPATPATATATATWIDVIIASALQQAGAGVAAAKAQQELGTAGISPAAIQALIATIFSGGHR